MTYLIGMGEQAKIFLLSLGFGFFIGILYDVVRLFRILLGNGKKSFLVLDVFYMLFASTLTFLFLLTQTGGSVRAYVLLGELLGFLIYFVTLGTLIAAVFDRLTAFLFRFFEKLFSGCKRFFHTMFSPLRRFFLKNAEKTCKKVHFSIKKSKIHLKSLHELLYNQSIRKSAQKDLSEIKESEDGEHGKKQKKEKTSKTKT